MSNTASPVWSKLFGTQDNDETTGLTLGKDGSIYVVGSTRYNLDGQSNAYGNEGAFYDGFIKKFNSDGTAAWTKLIGGTYDDQVLAVTTGSDGSIFTVGYTYSDTIDGQKKIGSYDGFIIKFNADGSKAWTKVIGSTEADYAQAVAAGKNGEVYVVLKSRGKLDGQTYQGSGDYFFVKFNADGSKAWTKNLGSTSQEGEDEAAITVGSDGAIYIGGNTFGNLGGQKHSNDGLPYGSSDASVTKFLPDGSMAWTRLLGGTNTDETRAVVTGSDGSVYIAGITQSRVFDGIPLDFSAAFVAKFNSDGTKAWVKIVKVDQGDYKATTATALSIGGNGAIYLSGTTGTYLNGEQLPTVGAYGTAAYTMMLTADGSTVWTKLFGSSTMDAQTRANANAISADGQFLYVAGETAGTAGSQGTFYGQVTVNSAVDSYLTKWSLTTLNQPQDVIKVETHTLTVLVKPGVLGSAPVLLKDLAETITLTNGVETAHTIVRTGTTYPYSAIDALVTTVTRDGDFTSEFKAEIAQSYPSVGNISYDQAINLVGIAKIDSTLISVAGADGDYVN